VEEHNGRPVIYVSRSHPNLVKKLFEQEVPEIASGIVEIVSVAREAGSRTKIAVASRDESVDPLGACVGQRGARVQAVMDELGSEKVDVIEWNSDPAVYIANALLPAKVIRVDTDNAAKADGSREMSARVIVPDHQYSLAIGRAGQNVRLAARLTGWKIDIKSESQFRELIQDEFMSRFTVADDELPTLRRHPTRILRRKPGSSPKPDGGDLSREEDSAKNVRLVQNKKEQERLAPGRSDARRAGNGRSDREKARKRRICMQKQGMPFTGG
jgi:transcription antitermination factor NusA-like protein